MTPVGCTTTALAQEELDPSWNVTPFATLRSAYSQRSDFDPAWELDPRRKVLVAAANADVGMRLGIATRGRLGF
jgi:hypothetical protein